MERYLNKGIKDIIAEFPAVGKILEEYNIGCVPCSVGSCLLKDVIEIHNLSPEDEADLMYRIEREIYPERKVEKRPPRRRRKKSPGALTYSPPVRKLVDEHKLIKRLIAAIPAVIEYIKARPQLDDRLIFDCVDFIRNYADKYHHMKEEDILFEYTDKELDIIKVIYDDHKAGRGHVKKIVEGAEEKDKTKIIEHLKGYGELLTQHINKEDEILYPWLDRGLSTRAVGELFRRFNEADASVGEEVPKNYERFVEELERRLKQWASLASR